MFFMHFGSSESRKCFSTISSDLLDDKIFFSELLLPSSQHFRRLHKGKKYLGYLAGIRIASCV